MSPQISIYDLIKRFAGAGQERWPDIPLQNMSEEAKALAKVLTERPDILHKLEDLMVNVDESTARHMLAEWHTDFNPKKERGG